MNDELTNWANGVTLRRTTTGYMWTIHVAADSNDPHDLREAAERARDLDDEFTELYGPLPEPKLSKAKSTRIR